MSFGIKPIFRCLIFHKLLSPWKVTWQDKKKKNRRELFPKLITLKCHLHKLRLELLSTLNKWVM